MFCLFIYKKRVESAIREETLWGCASKIVVLFSLHYSTNQGPDSNYFQGYEKIVCYRFEFSRGQPLYWLYYFEYENIASNKKSDDSTSKKVFIIHNDPHISTPGIAHRGEILLSACFSNSESKYLSQFYSWWIRAIVDRLLMDSLSKLWTVKKGNKRYSVNDNTILFHLFKL